MTREIPADGRLLLQLRSDRRLGHEWDDWDGEPLANGGSFATGAGMFFWVAALAGVMAMVAAGGLVWLLAPRSVGLSPVLPAVGWWAVAVTGGAWLLWLAGVGISLTAGTNLFPPVLAERGVLPRVIPGVEWVGRRVGVPRDPLGNSILAVFNGLAMQRERGSTPPDELLILLPRCLDRESMRRAMEVSSRHGVPMFVASRGRYAREMIRKRRPRGVIAVACERDLVSGVHDVAGRLPVLGSVLTLPDGPCRNTVVDAEELDRRVRAMLGG